MVQLIELLAGRKLAKLAVFFLSNPSVELSQGDVAKKVKLAKATLVKWLRHLARLGIIKVRAIGRTNLYSLNRESVVVRQLKVIDNIARLEKLKAILSSYNVKAYLYGSSARGEDSEGSDFDVLVVGRLKREDIIRDVNKLSEELKRNVRLSIFTPLDWSEMARKDKPFYERVEKDKVEI